MYQLRPDLLKRLNAREYDEGDDYVAFRVGTGIQCFILKVIIDRRCNRYDVQYMKRHPSQAIEIISQLPGIFPEDLNGVIHNMVEF